MDGALLLEWEDPTSAASKPMELPADCANQHVAVPAMPGTSG
jgi:hypothetical protein